MPTKHATPSQRTALAVLAREAERDGARPHAPVQPGGNAKKQVARQLKCSCLLCGYIARVARAWIEQGAPFCGCCTDEDGMPVRMCGPDGADSDEEGEE